MATTRGAKSCPIQPPGQSRKQHTLKVCVDDVCATASVSTVGEVVGVLALGGLAAYGIVKLIDAFTAPPLQPAQFLYLPET